MQRHEQHRQFIEVLHVPDRGLHGHDADHGPNAPPKLGRCVGPLRRGQPPYPEGEQQGGRGQHCHGDAVNAGHRRQCVLQTLDMLVTAVGPGAGHHRAGPQGRSRERRGQPCECPDLRRQPGSAEAAGRRPPRRSMLQDNGSRHQHL